MSLDADLRARAEAWAAQDPDAETRDELNSLLARADAGEAEAVDDLASRFDGRLQFGTAGLRGELGAGSARMNRVLVAQAAAGFAAFLVGRASGDAAGSTDPGVVAATAAGPSIVIGYDGRKNSDVFARDTAEIMAAAGVSATLLPRALPTPVLAFAVRHLATSAGVMVTASHNPPRDNGYKVYLGDADQGSQIVSPVDGEIAALIERAAEGSVLDLPRSDDYVTAGDDIVADYVQLTAAVAGPPIGRTVQPRVVYTAMHGVGWEVARRVFATAGFTEPIPVAEQAAPDPAFPTVAFPNPEEPGALDLSFETAERVGADLIIANDPDADRLAVAIPVGVFAAGSASASGSAAAPDAGSAAAMASDSTSAPGSGSPAAPASGSPAAPAPAGAAWRRLSGNEVGAILGWRAAARLQAAGGTGALAASIVSSPALRAVADAYGLPYADTLTGFKWVSRVDGLAYGYEEALGYLVDPAKVRDKDGISAAVDLLSLASELTTSGSTLEEHLRDFDATFGAFASSQVSLRVSDLAEIPRITTALRAAPPASIGGHPVDRLDDFSEGFEQFPPGDILRFWLTGDDTHDGSRVIVRPSGTEPKLKVYIDAWSTSGDPAARRRAADAVVAELDSGVRALLQ